VRWLPRFSPPASDLLIRQTPLSVEYVTKRNARFRPSGDGALAASETSFQLDAGRTMRRHQNARECGTSDQFVSREETTARDESIPQSVVTTRLVPLALIVYSRLYPSLRFVGRLTESCRDPIARNNRPHRDVFRYFILRLLLSLHPPMRGYSLQALLE